MCVPIYVLQASCPKVGTMQQLVNLIFLKRTSFFPFFRCLPCIAEFVFEIRLHLVVLKNVADSILWGEMLRRLGVGFEPRFFI